jgi:hypothetical protein
MRVGAHTTLRVTVIAPLLLLALALARSARANEPTCDPICSVNRSCSSTGVACAPDDRACMSGATSRGLEVKCEQSCDTGTRFVYCPPDTARSESGFVWVLLALAGLLAVGGTTLAWFALRKKV